MDVPSAAFWLDAITAGAAVAWLADAWFVAASTRRCREPIRGERRVDTPAAETMRSLTQQLATGAGAVGMRHTTIDAATEREVRWHAPGPFKHTGRITTTPGTGGTRVEWEVTVQRSGLLLTATVVVWLGALVVIALHMALRTYAVSSEHEAMRGMVVQMVQAVHVLWPPLMFAGIARKLRSEIARDVERMVGNAPFAARAATVRS